MRRLLILVAAALSVSVPAAGQTAAPIRMIAADQARADIALMVRALETVHPGLYRRTSKPVMSRAFARLASGITAPISDAELYGRVSAVLALIRCTHTKAEQPATIERWRTDNPSHLPFRFRIVAGRMLVVAADPAGPVVGSEVLAINGLPVKQLIRNLARYVAVDGDTDWARTAYLADDGDLMGADFDHFLPYVAGFTPRFVIRARTDDRSPPTTAEIAAISFRQWTRLPGTRPFRQGFGDTSWKMLDAQTGYLQIPTFVNYRKPVDAQALYSRALNELRGAGMTRLIVDLRLNGGGSDDAALALVDHLAAAPYVYQRRVRLKAVRYGDLPQYIETWGDREALFNPPLANFTPSADGWHDLKPQQEPAVLQPRTPAAARFAGPVTLLTGPANASGATMVISRLRDMGRVQLVGGRSGGSGDGPTAGTIFTVKLPASGIGIRVPLAFNEMAVRRFDRRGGVRPDIEVIESVSDVRMGRDPVLSAAIAGAGRR